MRDVNPLVRAVLEFQIAKVDGDPKAISTAYAGVKDAVAFFMEEFDPSDNTFDMPEEPSIDSPDSSIEAPDSIAEEQDTSIEEPAVAAEVDPREHATTMIRALAKGNLAEDVKACLASVECERLGEVPDFALGDLNAALERSISSAKSLGLLDG